MSRLIRVFRSAALRFSAEGTPFLAQALAFNVLFAAIPLLLVGVALIAFVYGTDEGIARANDAIGLYAPQLQDLVANNLDVVVRYRGVTGVIGLLALAWSGKNVFQGMAYALNRSLGVMRYRHFVWDIAVGLTLVPVVGVVLVLATALPVVITLIVQFARPRIPALGAPDRLVRGLAGPGVRHHHAALRLPAQPPAGELAGGPRRRRRRLAGLLDRADRVRGLHHLRGLRVPRSTARSRRCSCCCCGST